MVTLRPSHSCLRPERKTGSAGLTFETAHSDITITLFWTHAGLILVYGFSRFFFAPKLQFRNDITQLSFKHIAFFRQWLVRCRNTSEGFLGLVCPSNSAQSFSVSFTWSNSISSVMFCCLKTTPGVRCTLLFGATVVQTYPDVTRLLPCCNSTIYMFGLLDFNIPQCFSRCLW